MYWSYSRVLFCGLGLKGKLWVIIRIGTIIFWGLTGTPSHGKHKMWSTDLEENQSYDLIIDFERGTLFCPGEGSLLPNKNYQDVPARPQIWHRLLFHIRKFWLHLVNSELSRQNLGSFVAVYQAWRVLFPNHFMKKSIFSPNTHPSVCNFLMEDFFFFGNCKIFWWKIDFWEVLEVPEKSLNHKSMTIKDTFMTH